jgi:hypothetical protein
MHLTQNDYEDSLNIKRKPPKMNPMKKYCSLLSTECLLMHYKMKCTGSMILGLDNKVVNQDNPTTT